MKLEIGKTYKTRSGRTVTIESSIKKSKWVFFKESVFIGKSEGSFFSLYFDKKGRIFGYEDHIDNIKEEVNKASLSLV